jgi:hypothetical protein
MDGRSACFGSAPVAPARFGVVLVLRLAISITTVLLSLLGHHEHGNLLPLWRYNIGAFRQSQSGESANVKAGLAGSCSIGYGDPPCAADSGLDSNTVIRPLMTL